MLGAEDTRYLEFLLMFLDKKCFALLFYGRQESIGLALGE